MHSLLPIKFPKSIHFLFSHGITASFFTSVVSRGLPRFLSFYFQSRLRFVRSRSP